MHADDLYLYTMLDRNTGVDRKFPLEDLFTVTPCRSSRREDHKDQREDGYDRYNSIATDFSRSISQMAYNAFSLKT